MIKSKEFRYISSNQSSAKLNMLIDKALFNAYEPSDKPIFRLYSWNDSFTVGISQDLEEYDSLYKEYKSNCAKRMTGGGVLFHGHDISYSLILPLQESSLKVKEMYESICSFLIKFYENLGLEASFAKDISSIVLSKSSFCQVGFEPYDIIVNNQKIGGNAQKWRRKAVFQHGSIPLFSPRKSDEFGHSLKDLGISLDFKEAKRALEKAFKQTFDVELIPSVLNVKELSKVRIEE